MSEQACETPITKLLADVPEDLRVTWPTQWSEDDEGNECETGHTSCPIGYLVKRLLAEHESLKADRDKWEREASEQHKRCVDFQAERNAYKGTLEAMADDQVTISDGYSKLAIPKMVRLFIRASLGEQTDG